MENPKENPKKNVFFFFLFFVSIFPFQMKQKSITIFFKIEFDEIHFHSFFLFLSYFFLKNQTSPYCCLPVSNGPSWCPCPSPPLIWSLLLNVVRANNLPNIFSIYFYFLCFILHNAFGTLTHKQTHKALI